jgi:hypothetical protein
MVNYAYIWGFQTNPTPNCWDTAGHLAANRMLGLFFNIVDS